MSYFEPMFDMVKTIRNIEQERIDKQLEIDTTRLKQAFNEAELSKCIKHKVGCVITTLNGRLCASGVNGTPKSQPNCCDHFAGRINNHDTRVEHRVWAEANEVHAEVNALLHANRTDVEGGTLYVTHRPCKKCAPIIANSGLDRVIYSIDGLTGDSNDGIFGRVKLIQIKL